MNVTLRNANINENVSGCPNFLSSPLRASELHHFEDPLTIPKVEEDENDRELMI